MHVYMYTLCVLVKSSYVQFMHARICIICILCVHECLACMFCVVERFCVSCLVKASSQVCMHACAAHMRTYIAHVYARARVNIYLHAHKYA